MHENDEGSYPWIPALLSPAPRFSPTPQSLFTRALRGLRTRNSALVLMLSGSNAARDFVVFCFAIDSETGMRIQNLVMDEIKYGDKMILVAARARDLAANNIEVGPAERLASVARKQMSPNLSGSAIDISKPEFWELETVLRTHTFCSEFRSLIVGRGEKAEKIRFALITEDETSRDVSVLRKVLKRACKSWEEVKEIPLMGPQSQVDLVLVHRGSLLDLAPRFADLKATLANRKAPLFFEFGFRTAKDLHKFLQRKCLFLDVMWPREGGGVIGVSYKTLVACEDLEALLNFLHRFVFQRQLEGLDKPWRIFAIENVLGRLKDLARDPLEHEGDRKRYQMARMVFETAITDPSRLKGSVFTNSYLLDDNKEHPKYNPTSADNNPFKRLMAVPISRPSEPNFEDDTFVHIDFLMLTNRATLRRGAVLVTPDEKALLEGKSEYGTELVSFPDVEAWVRKEIGGAGKLYVWEDGQPTGKDDGINKSRLTSIMPSQLPVAAVPYPQMAMVGMGMMGMGMPQAVAQPNVPMQQGYFGPGFAGQMMPMGYPLQQGVGSMVPGVGGPIPLAGPGVVGPGVVTSQMQPMLPTQQGEGQSLVSPPAFGQQINANAQNLALSLQQPMVSNIPTTSLPQAVVGNIPTTSLQQPVVGNIPATSLQQPMVGNVPQMMGNVPVFTQPTMPAFAQPTMGMQMPQAAFAQQQAFQAPTAPSAFIPQQAQVPVHWQWQQPGAVPPVQPREMNPADTPMNPQAIPPAKPSAAQTLSNRPEVPGTPGEVPPSSTILGAPTPNPNNMIPPASNMSMQEFAQMYALYQQYKSFQQYPGAMNGFGFGGMPLGGMQPMPGAMPMPGGTMSMSGGTMPMPGAMPMQQPGQNMYMANVAGPAVATTVPGNTEGQDTTGGNQNLGNGGTV
ncbi:hypothetical protein M427DRAFT_389671 [Gonapodya prolifera JEL478]|uniref:Uncharacterized protein n=1 Tax=Gonapodya prolifera (strain JEL478) TaxID=1344416 RepID=A0A139A8X6_GONPJ|nr:hypothetical protein M427DRAFT_389671 [Gonapodya prolifera JEL478]|eukprot:KXS12853.1 hypothetical protein M427DRAFT_389671 [Gonapodya prolifera JEL478]